jgi:Uma2 family endonuclease
MTKTERKPKFANVQELQEYLGHVPLERILMEPAPGEATVKDLLRIVERKEAIVELVHGTLVEKPMGFSQAVLAGYLLRTLINFLEQFEDVGICAGADATMRMLPGIVRLPDVSFIRWERLSDEAVPQEAVPEIVPNLVVEVLSQGNTDAEMQRKRTEYFKAGVELVWIIDIEARTVDVYTSLKKVKRHTTGDTLNTGSVIPGFTLPVDDLFKCLDKKPPTKSKGKKKSGS